MPRKIEEADPPGASPMSDGRAAKAGTDSERLITPEEESQRLRVSKSWLAKARMRGEPLTDLIDEYVHEFRPTMLRGSNASWLFPGEGGKPKSTNGFGTEMTKRIQKAIGLRITPHQFRHAAAAIFLKHRPADYETVRRLLGHRSIQTTIMFYCGLQTTQATEQFGNLIRQQIKFDPVD
jgi:integrase